MKIVIAGAGRIGGSVAKVLVDGGHDVTVIDSNPQTILNLSGDIDANCIEGSASDIDVLSDAGCGNADLFISATESDEVNLVSSICAKKLGCKYIIARIRDIEYSNRVEFLKEVFGLYVVINPELECAKEISRIIRFPGASRVFQFSSCSTEVAQYVIPKGSVLAGKTIAELKDITSAKIIIGLITRKNEIIIPNGSTVINDNDCMYIISSQKDQRLFFSDIGALKKPVKSAMILGGNIISVYLSRALIECGIDVSIIEKDARRCDTLADIVPGAKVINGDGMDSNVLLEENILSSDAFVALTADEGDNLITSLYAKDLGIENIVTKIDRAHFVDVINKSGLKSVVVPKQVICDQIVGYVKAIENSFGCSMEALHRVADGKVDIVEFIVPDGFNKEQNQIKDMGIKKDVILCSITRKGRLIIPDGSTVLIPKDAVIVMAPANDVSTLGDIIDHA